VERAIRAASFNLRCRDSFTGRQQRIPGRRDISGAGTRSVVLVGMMARAKSTIGRRLATRLRLPFLDADCEIELAHAGMTIPEISKNPWRAVFQGRRGAGDRAGCSAAGLAVLATGGGAFMREETRGRISDKAISIWLKADADTIMRRVKRRADRPLLQTADPPPPSDA